MYISNDNRFLLPLQAQMYAERGRERVVATATATIMNESMSSRVAIRILAAIAAAAEKHQQHR